MKMLSCLRAGHTSRAPIQKGLDIVPRHPANDIHYLRARTTTLRSFASRPSITAMTPYEPPTARIPTILLYILTEQTPTCLSFYDVKYTLNTSLVLFPSTITLLSLSNSIFLKGYLNFGIPKRSVFRLGPLFVLALRVTGNDARLA